MYLVKVLGTRKSNATRTKQNRFLIHKFHLLACGGYLITKIIIVFVRSVFFFFLFFVCIADACDKNIRELYQSKYLLSAFLLIAGLCSFFFNALFCCLSLAISDAYH